MKSPTARSLSRAMFSGLRCGGVYWLWRNWLKTLPLFVSITFQAFGSVGRQRSAPLSKVSLKSRGNAGRGCSPMAKQLTRRTQKLKPIEYRTFISRTRNGELFLPEELDAPLHRLGHGGIMIAQDANGFDVEAGRLGQLG